MALQRATQNRWVTFHKSPPNAPEEERKRERNAMATPPLTTQSLIAYGWESVIPEGTSKIALRGVFRPPEAIYGPLESKPLRHKT
jgi:hypothetical protein